MYDLDMDPGNIYIEIGGRTNCSPKSWPRKNELSEVNKLYCPLSGTGWVQANGHRVTLYPGNIYLIPAQQMLSYGTESGTVIDWLHFLPESPRILQALLSIQGVRELESGVAHWRAVCREFETFFSKPSESLTCRVHAMILDLTGRIIEGYVQPDLQATERIKRLEPAIRFMDDHSTQFPQPTLAQVAATIHISAEHMHRLFREAMGMTPFEYILNRRMQLARTLLLQGKLRVGEVAQACGYESALYFSRVFRRHYKCTPRSMRQGGPPRP